MMDLAAAVELAKTKPFVVILSEPSSSVSISAFEKSLVEKFNNCVFYSIVKDTQDFLYFKQIYAVDRFPALYLIVNGICIDKSDVEFNDINSAAVVWLSSRLKKLGLASVSGSTSSSSVSNTASASSGPTEGINTSNPAISAVAPQALSNQKPSTPAASSKPTSETKTSNVQDDKNPVKAAAENLKDNVVSDKGKTASKLDASKSKELRSAEVSSQVEKRLTQRKRNKKVVVQLTTHKTSIEIEHSKETIKDLKKRLNLNNCTIKDYKMQSLDDTVKLVDIDSILHVNGEEQAPNEGNSFWDLITSFCTWLVGLFNNLLKMLTRNNAASDENVDVNSANDIKKESRKIKTFDDFGKKHEAKDRETYNGNSTNQEDGEFK
jgi:hypothetical protein